MPRDWELEWEAMHADERAAFTEYHDLQLKITDVFRDSGNPSLELMDAADAAFERWEKAKAAETKFIREYFDSQPTQSGRCV